MIKHVSRKTLHLYVITSLVSDSQNVSYTDTTAYMQKKLFKGIWSTLIL
jgi:hypothetical protein